MKQIKKYMLVSFLLLLAIGILGACSSNQEETKKNDHENMEEMHSETGEVPAGLKEKKNPTYPVGSKVIIHADHMAGMDGTEAKVVGAYDTIVYSVSYTPVDGGEKVTKHKWIIHEELENVGKDALKQGEEATINGSHMEGMDGAAATIDTAEKTTVYMIDYTPATGGAMVKNHQWVTESELKAAE